MPRFSGTYTFGRNILTVAANDTPNRFKEGADYVCLTPDTLVFTKNGVSKITDIKLGDEVLSHGGYSKVLKTFERDVNEDIVILKIRGGDRIKLTANHPVLAIKDTLKEDGISNHGYQHHKIRKIATDYIPKWIPAGELEKGDVVVQRFTNGTRDIESINIKDYITIQYIEKDNWLYPIGKNQTGKIQINPKGKKIFSIVRVNQDFLNILGLYISDGSSNIKNGMITFSFNALKENDLAEFCKQLLLNVFKLEAKVYTKQNVICVQINSKIIAQFLQNLCGKLPQNKNIPNWALYLPTKKQLALLDGLMLGDGYKNNKTNTYKYVTVSRNLAYNLRTILFRCGFLNSINIKPEGIYNIQGRTGKTKEKYEISFTDHKYRSYSGRNGYLHVNDGLAFLTITDVKKEYYEGKVYNLEIDKFNSYTVPGATLHNCDGTADEVEIQAALTQAKLEGSSGALGSCVMLLPGTYTIAASINMNSSNQGVGLIGYSFTDTSAVRLNGPALGSTTPVILIRDTIDNASSTGGFLIRGLRITGNGYGIELNGNNGTDNEGVAAITIEDCLITGCGNIGIYGHGSCWTIVIDKCRVDNNSTGQTGVNSAEIYFVTTSTEQNGNALRITNSRWGGTAARGLVWCAAGLYVAGCDIEGGAGGNIGIDIGANNTNGAFGITITGNYFEGWAVSAIRLGDTGASTTTHANSAFNTSGIFISGNYINRQSASSGIQLGTVQSGFIDGGYFETGGTGRAIAATSITSASAGLIIGSIASENTGTGNFSTLGQATKLGDYTLNTAGARSISLSGDKDQVGLTWAAGAVTSYNYGADPSSTATGYWYLPTKAGDYITGFSVLAGGEVTDSVVLTLQRMQGDIGDIWGTVWTTVTLDSGTNPKTFSNGGGDPPSQGQQVAMNVRVESGYRYRVKMDFSWIQGGVRQVYNLTMRYITE